MNTHLNAVVDSIALRVAELERDLELAIENHANCARGSSTLASRIEDTRTLIQAHRSTASTRELTDKEVASLNLAIMDLADLERMAAEATVCTQAAAAAIDTVRDALARARRELFHLVGTLRCNTLLEEVHKREAALCESLMDLWVATREVRPDARFINAWIPGAGLRRAAVHHQPPDSGSFS